MKAHELIALLQQHDPDAEVLMEDLGMAVILAEHAWENDGDLDDDVLYSPKQRVVGVEAGFGSYSELSYRGGGMSFDLCFTVQPHVPEEDGVPAVRIMGYQTPASNPTRVRRREGPGLCFIESSAPETTKTPPSRS